METAFGLVPTKEQTEILSYLQKCSAVLNCRIRKLGDTEEVDVAPFALLVNSPYVVYVVGLLN